MEDPPDSVGEDAPAQHTEEAPETAIYGSMLHAGEVHEREDEATILMQELSLSEQPVEPQLSLQPVDQLHPSMQPSMQPSVQPESSVNGSEPTEGEGLGREASVGGDGLTFGHNFLPPFANAENKALNTDIKEHEEKLESADAGLEEVMNRAQIMAEHLKSVQSELAYTQARVTSKRKEIQSEAHLKSLSERQLARYVADLKLIKKERDELTEKVSSLQNQIYRANEKMDQFKILMNWSQEELEQWTMTQQQKEEDSEAIERYAAQDRAKIKDLDLAITRMSRTVAGHKSDLQREVTDTQSVQMQLRKAADDFEILHKERQELIKQWEDAVAQMRRTDAAIQTASELFADSKLELREKQRRLDIAAQFLDDQISNNKDCEDQIETLERDLARLRTEFNSRQSEYQEVSEQVEIIKTMLSKSGNDHTRMQAENAALAKELDAKRLRLDDVRKKVANNRRKLEGEYVHLDTLASKEKELDNMANLESKRLEEVDKSLHMLEKVQFDKSQHLFKERQREKDLISEISGGQAQNRNLVRRIQQLDDNVIRQQELLYNVEFQLQKMERRVARAQGERSDEETAALNSRIKVLTVQLEGVNAQHTMLLGQVRKAEDDLEHANSARTRLTREREQVQSDLAALNLEADMVGRAVKKAATERQQKLVDLDVRKLEVQHLRESLNTKADEVFVLENRKLQLEQSLKERRHEISIHKQALEAELKLVKGDLHRVTQELQERRQRVQKLEAKFSVVSTKKKSMYEEEEPKSQAYYVIKAAQQRQELQATGDRLDGENHRLQKEVATLERTLEQMAASNQAYTKSFKPVNEKRAFAERSKLRERLDKVYDRLKFKRQEERNLMGDVWQAELRIQQLQHEQDTLQQIVQELGRHKEEALQSVQREEEKMAKAQGRFQHACESSGASNEELKCVRLELMKGTTQAMLSQLSRIADQFPTLDIKAALDVTGLGVRAGDSSRPQSAASLAQGMGELEAV